MPPTEPIGRNALRRYMIVDANSNSSATAYEIELTETTDRISDSSVNSYKCDLATTSNIGLTGSFAIDGTVPPNGFRIFVRSQDDSDENGIYIYDNSTFQLITKEDETFVVHVKYGATLFNTWWFFKSGDSIEKIRGDVVDGSITNDKLDTDIKIGSLGDVLTDVKESVVGAINWLRNQFMTLSSNFTSHVSSIATAVSRGHVMVDGSSIVADANGKISVNAGGVSLLTNTIDIRGLEKRRVKKISGVSSYTIEMPDGSGLLDHYGDNVLLVDTSAPLPVGFTKIQVTLPSATSCYRCWFHIIDIGNQASTKNIEVLCQGADKFVDGTTVRVISVNGKGAEICSVDDNVAGGTFAIFERIKL